MKICLELSEEEYEMLMRAITLSKQFCENVPFFNAKYPILTSLFQKLCEVEKT